MTNKEIANQFRALAKIMELHKENPFKIRSYQSAYMNLRKLDAPLLEMSEVELASMKGIGKAIAAKIRELVDTGAMQTLQKYKDITPAGVQDMLSISGFGPKKVRTVWKELEVESIGELLYAVNENRLLELKGFGEKTQEDLKTKLAYFQSSQGQFLYARAEQEAQAFVSFLQTEFPQAQVALTGAMRRAKPTLSVVEVLVAGATIEELMAIIGEEHTQVINQSLHINRPASYPITVYFCGKEEWGSKQFRYTASKEFMSAFLTTYPEVDFKQIADEKAVFEKVGATYLAPALREHSWTLAWDTERQAQPLIQASDIKGVIHTHTTYSDGVNTIEEMAAYAQEQGYTYIGITDHSKSAFYANGLKEDRVLAQMQAIDELNKTYETSGFRILKGIESDILADGRLDYEEEILKQFDFVIASIHSNLRMDEQKATQRLINAIEQPYTHILGHPTGRLLLSRPAYPIDHQKVIDACAANGVAIELNANPLRLDMDYTWIPYAIEKGVLISINPDAHSCKGIHDIHYGVLAAQKGGLYAAACLNSLEAVAFLEKLRKK